MILFPQIPEPRPGTCVDDSRTLPDITVNFVKSHSLMDGAVPALFSKPIFTRISLQSRLTSIAVDNQISCLKGQHYDILFLGTGMAIRVFLLIQYIKIIKIYYIIIHIFFLTSSCSFFVLFKHRVSMIHI